MNVYFPVLHTVVNYVYEMQEPHTWLTHHVAQAAVGMKALKHGPSNQGKEVERLGQDISSGKKGDNALLCCRKEGRS